MSPADLTSAHLDLIHQANVLVGGKRHLNYFENLPCEKIEISGGLRSVVEKIRDRMPAKNVVVLASGDPLYYGIGAYIIGVIEAQNVKIHPNVSSVAAAFARIGQSWNDAFVISFHGSSREHNLPRILATNDKIAVYTDPKHNPSWLAGRLKQLGISDVDFWVFEQLGDPSENYGRCTLAQAMQTVYQEPNIVLLIRKKDSSSFRRTIYAGMPDDGFKHENGLITKSEIRAVSIAKLALGPGMTLWDLGAGSGSISIEASAFLNGGRIFAVERNKSRIDCILENRRRFGATGLTVIEAELPDGLADLPAPDRIFIGGGGRKLADITAAAAHCLKPGGILVVNTVLLENLEAVTTIFRKTAFEADIVQIQVSRGKKMPWGRRLEALNPVWIVSGIKSGENK